VTGVFEEPAGGGLPLGIMDDSAYDEQSYGPLRAGQVIIVSTDGVWESANEAREQFGKDRLRGVIREAASRPAEQIVEAIVERLNAFRGKEKATDDVTFVVIKVKETPTEPEGSSERSATLAGHRGGG
jgi:sigma-B regulation protein RsbU (phosphoserine phosphatase)